MILFKKATRAIWANKKAYIACVLLIVIAVFINNIIGMTATVFTRARDDYYKDYRLADVFAKVRALPAAALTEIGQIDGVREAAGRYVYDARALIPGNDKFITLRITSLDGSYEGVQINSVAKYGGDFSDPSDVMIGAAFLDEHGLKKGDAIRVIIERREFDLNICAIAESPEYVYPVKDIMEVLPNNELFGYGFMTLEGLWTLTGKFGVYNDICLALDEGASFDALRAPLEDQLAKSGLIALYQQKDLPSVAMLEMELGAHGTMSEVLPLMFMFMSMVVLYLMLKRVIEQERSQIGVLKAFGYSGGAVTLHYTLYGAVTGLAGGVIGCLYSFAAIRPYVDMYKFFFNLPVGDASIPSALLARGLALAVGGGVLGGWIGARRSLKLNPAEAMRPEAPKTAKADFFSKLPLVRLMLSTSGSMAFRSISRSKMRSAVIVLGIAFAFALLSFFGSFNQMIDYMMLNQFSKVQRFDAKVYFTAPLRRDAAVDALYRVNGVEFAEGIVELPVEMKNRHLKTGVNLIGLTDRSPLYTIYDNTLDAILAPPADGVLINDVLAAKLDAGKGDALSVSSPLLDRDITLIVTGVAEQNLSMAGYMDIDALSGLFNLDNAATSAVVRVSSMGGLTELYEDAAFISYVEDKATLFKNYEDLLQPFGFLLYFMWLMAVVVAFAIIYNTSAISLSERKREYATLRVVGMHVKEVGAIMGFEYWILCLCGILAGIPLNIALKNLLASVFVTDSFSFPVITPLSAYLQALAGCVVAVLLANRSAVRQIKKFDMVEVLKERE